MSQPSPEVRKIIHIDMDCFYAAIEMRQNPSLQDKPIAVGGLPQQRGVLATCNYEARQYGLHSAMPSAHALKLCPNLVLLPPNFRLYQQVSQQMHQILRRYTDIIEPIALDEAYLDVTHCKQHAGSATWIAQAIRQQIWQQLHLTASAGIAPLKFLAKIASEQNKPNGQYLIAPEQVQAFIAQLPLTKLPGVGKVTAQKLAQLGLKSCADIQQYSLHALLNQFGKYGQRLWDFSHGIDNRAVSPQGLPKSLGAELTLLRDIEQLAQAEPILEQLYQKLQQRLNRHPDLIAQSHYKLGVKLKFDDFQLTSLEKSGLAFNQQNFYTLLQQIWLRRQQRKIRLIGLHIQVATPPANLTHQQMSLW